MREYKRIFDENFIDSSKDKIEIKAKKYFDSDRTSYRNDIDYDRAAESVEFIDIDNPLDPDYPLKPVNEENILLSDINNDTSLNKSAFSDEYVPAYNKEDIDDEIKFITLDNTEDTETESFSDSENDFESQLYKEEIYSQSVSADEEIVFVDIDNSDVLHIIESSPISDDNNSIYADIDLTSLKSEPITENSDNKKSFFNIFLKK